MINFLSFFLETTPLSVLAVDTFPSLRATSALRLCYNDRLRCNNRIDSYLFKVEGVEKLKMKVTFIDCVCVIFQSGEAMVVEKMAGGHKIYREVVTSLVGDAPEESQLPRPLLNIKVKFSVKDLKMALIPHNSTLFEIRCGNKDSQRYGDTAAQELEKLRAQMTKAEKRTQATMTTANPNPGNTV
ncbi:hypothetical protein Tco_0199475 [Tanacetum coccineum]